MSALRSLKAAVVASLLLAAGTAAAPARKLPAADRPAPASFVNDVIPVLTKAGCNAGACHGAQHGKGGFRLSLLGFDPDADHAAITREAGGRRVVRSQPGESLLLRKPTLGLPHMGGRRLLEGSPEWRLIREWLAQGAPGPVPGERHLTRLRVTPERRTLKRGERLQLRVTAVYSDGSSREVTARARYGTNHEGVVTIDERGLATGAGPGETELVVRYGSHVAVARITLPFGKTGRKGPPPGSYVDALVQQGWSRLGLSPAGPATDEEFARRLHLDAIGTLPDPERVRKFAADRDPGKRQKLIDEVLERPEWVDFWTLYFGDLLRNNRETVGEKGMWALREWIAEALRQDRPYPEMVRELIDVRGSTFRSAPANYYSVARTPEDLAETTSQVFLGVRLQCAKCHNHPFERWTQDDYYGFAAFFARVRYKGFPGIGAFGGDQLVLQAARGEIEHPRTGRKMAPRPLAAPAAAPDEGSRLSALADWLADPSNPFVARNIVNRIWGRLMGRGLIEPVDDVRASNPPSHPELLDALAKDFAAHRFSLKHLMRVILSSQAYGLSSRPGKANAADTRFYSRYYVRRLSAEQLLDALCRVTGVPESFPDLPPGTRAIALPDNRVRSYFLDTFGRPPRTSVCECERDGEPNLTQTLHLLNGAFLQTRIASDQGRLAALLKEQRADAEIVEILYRLAYARPPSRDEKETALKLAAAAPSRREGLEDLLWTLLNSREFLLNH